MNRRHVHRTQYVNLSTIDLNLLVALDAIIKERSVTRAGKIIGLSQPAMSNTLARLREMFGDPLLDRVGRDYQLTPLALQLAEPLQAILTDLERTLDLQPTFDPASSRRVFTIAGSDNMTTAVFQPLLTRVSHDAPGVRLRFRHSGRDTAQQLAARGVDLSIQPAHSHRDFSSHHLFSDRFVCAIWTGNTEVTDVLSEAQFCRLGHVSYSYPPYDFCLLDYFAGPIARTLRIQATTDCFMELPFLLRGTNMIALVQEGLARRLERAANVRILECPVKLAPLRVSMWWNPLYEVDVGHAWLRATLIESVTQRADANTSVVVEAQ
jgi:DNA-binding transcriptional LysR family regulator